MKGIARLPVVPCTITSASSAASATDKSEALVATQASDQPRMA